MAARLILNADDFGLTPGINRAVRELHQAGVLTSATLMATGRAFADAVAIARANPTLGVGCHVVLIDGLPVSDPGLIPTLMGADGRHFRTSLGDFVQALLRGAIREDEIELEALAQVQKVQQAGIQVTHLDTHKHTHLFPAVTRPLLHVAEKSSVSAIRNPFEPKWCRSLGSGSLTRRLQLALLDSLLPQFKAHRPLRNAVVLSTEGTIGISATGSLDPTSLQQILEAVPDGLWELVLHPGYTDAELAAITTRLRSQRNVEREALLEAVPKFLAQPNAPDLIHYGDLSSSGLVRKMGVATPDTGFNHA